MKLKMFQSIKKIIYEEIHKQPYGTEAHVNINDIIVPYTFKHSNPKEYKIDRARLKLNKKGYVDKPISVEKVIDKHGRHKNVKYILRNEYTRFLVLEEGGFTEIPVKIVSSKAK